ncbi:MAG: hypothetical protein Q7S44_02195 [bacterium]|nr:hypothetical protein [bacterium]
MKLPNRKNAIISREKLINYALSETSPEGKNKAKFFRKIGFNKTDVQSFKKVIRQLAKSEEAKEVKDKSLPHYGTKYILEGKINSPIGKTVTIRTIWIIDEGQKRPRLVTVYPV